MSSNFDMGHDFVDALVESPIGVVLLAELEAMQRPDVRPREIQVKTLDVQAVDRATEWVNTVPVGCILYEAVQIAEREIGPHVSGASVLASAYQWADQRKPIAVALAARLGDALHEPLDQDNQEWWTTLQEQSSSGRSYDDGSLLWTVQNLPLQVHSAAVDAWDYGGSTSRWRISIKKQPRIKEIHRPEDWIELVKRYPGPLSREGYRLCWKFESPNPGRRLTWAPTGRIVFGWRGRLHDRRPRLVPRDRGLSELLALPGQKAARPLNSSQFVDINWRAASQDYDGCHLSWAGFLSTEGYVCDLGDGCFTALYGFGSERTLWLSDVFGEVTPLEAPEGLTGSSSDNLGADVTIDHQRAAQDLINLEVTLGRRGPPLRTDHEI